MNVCIECRHCREVKSKHEVSIRDRYECLATEYMYRHEVTGETMNVPAISCFTARRKEHLCGSAGRFFVRDTTTERRNFRKTVCEDLILIVALLSLVYFVGYVLHLVGVVTL